MEIENIKTYVINLRHRTDRYQHIINEFCGRKEFDLKVVVACEHKVGAIGLWETLKHIILNLVEPDDEFILICEDDHQFTDYYNKELLWKSIIEAKSKKADVLIGGVSWYESALQISSDLFWIDKFSGLQFTIIYRKFFKIILDTDFEGVDAADYRISAVSKNKLLMHPFISVQKEFGYSDVTVKNNERGYVSQLFLDSSEKLDHLKSIYAFYNIKNY